MQATEYPPLIEAFLLIEQPRQRLGHWTKALAALDAPSAPPLAAIVAYYDPTCDQALLALRYDELALGPNKLGFVIEVALLAEVGMIQPAELSELERKRFLTERLTRCTLQVPHQRSALAALVELVRKIKDERKVQTPFAVRASTAPRGDTEDPVLLVTAKGTRDNMHSLPRAPSPTSRHVIARTRTKQPPPPTPVEKAPEAKRLVTNTRVVDPLTDLPNVSDVKVRASSPSLLIEPYLPTAPGQISNTIHARYLRSGRWVPIRVGALSIKGAALLAGALPRLHDRVDIAFTYAEHRVLVRGAVGKLSSVLEAEVTGASTFSVQFELDPTAKRQMTALLTAARAAKVTIKPPPPRATRRFPVEWPISLGTLRGSIKGDALDVSTGGMFVQSVFQLAVDSTLSFSMVIDDRGGPIAGRAKVVRRISEPEAKSNGLAQGFGLNVTEMSDAHRMRWLGFLARIERRSDKRVLIGASPARFAELQTAFASAGYAVTGGTDPGVLVQLANSDARPVDAALLDAGWLQNSSSASWVEGLFSARDVPCVTLHGDIESARIEIDKLLDVTRAV